MTTRIEKKIAELKSLSLDVQGSPEFQRLLAKMEAPYQPPVDLDSLGLEQSHLSRVERKFFNLDDFKALLKLAGECIVLLVLSWHLYNFFDIRLVGLRVGEVVDFLVSAAVFGWMLWLTRKTWKNWREERRERRA
jgi:hypothetical protein